jgi:hypothetical protein
LNHETNWIVTNIFGKNTMKNKKTELTRLSDWIFGPDLELFRDPRTRKSMVGCSICVLILVLTYDLFEKAPPVSLIPVIVLVALYFFMINILRHADELIREIIQKTGMEVLAAIVFFILLSKPLNGMGVDVGLDIDVVVYMACVLFVVLLILNNKLKM